jgi:hypothetical protein
MKKLFFLPLLLITCFCFAQNAKAIIGKPIKIGNILVAQNDFPDYSAMSWDDAKKACRALGEGWRLPNKAELNILYINRKNIKILNSWYWSSTEHNRDGAWAQSFKSGDQLFQPKGGYFFFRAVKSL